MATVITVFAVVIALAVALVAIAFERCDVADRERFLRNEDRKELKEGR